MRAPLLRRQSPEGDGAHCDASVIPVPGHTQVEVIRHYRNRGMPERQGRRLAGAPKSGNGIFVTGLSDFWWMLHNHLKKICP
jgi:hypothetical protein